MLWRIYHDIDWWNNKCLKCTYARSIIFVARYWALHIHKFSHNIVRFVSSLKLVKIHSAFWNQGETRIVNFWAYESCVSGFISVWYFFFVCSARCLTVLGLSMNFLSTEKKIHQNKKMPKKNDNDSVWFGCIDGSQKCNTCKARAHTVCKQWPFYGIDREMVDFLILISFPTFPNENKLIGLVVCVCCSFSRYLFKFWSTEMVMMFLGAWTKTMKLNIFMQSNLFHQIKHGYLWMPYVH